MAPGVVDPSATTLRQTEAPPDPGPDMDMDMYRTATALSPSLSPTAPSSPQTQPPESSSQGGNFIHSLIGHSQGGFSEVVRNSFSSLARRDHDAPSSTASPLGSAAAQATENIELAFSREESRPPKTRPPPEPQQLHLLRLPPELQLMILQRLDFADIVRLRKTCKQLRALASPHQISVLFGPAQLRMQLLGHCKVCLLYDPFRSRLLQPNLVDPGFPLASRCLDCAVKERDPRIRVGRKINMANSDTVWVCRWCGFPINEGGAFGCEQMHRFCYKRYNDVLFTFFVLGWLQLALGVVAGSLAWAYYPDAILVLGPTVANFILLWVCLCFLVFRGNIRRTYHYTLVLELVILVLWIPPVYHVASDVAHASGGPPSQSTQATLAMFVLNMFFRLVNLLGNILLYVGFVTTRWKRAGIPAWARPFHYLATALVMWTYPQSLEHKHPPDYL